MATDRIKLLFKDAPPGAFERLLSPKRKLFYGLFAFGPGTVLGLYLYSVKRRMERENEAVRMEQVQSELSVVKEQQNKDLVLANAIKEMRDRLKRLEAEAAASQQKPAGVAKAAESSEENRKAETKKPAVASVQADENKIEAALELLKHKETQQEGQKKEPRTWFASSLGGSRGRAKEQQKDMIKDDVAAYLAEQKK